MLSMPATLQDAIDMVECANPNECVEVNGDKKAIILWREYEDGSRSVVDLYFWE